MIECIAGFASVLNRLNPVFGIVQKFYTIFTVRN